MARRTIQECDLLKTEFDPEHVVTITIKSKGKKPRTYELSPEAAELLESALVSRMAHTVVVAGHDPANMRPSAPADNNAVASKGEKKTVGDFDIDEDLIETKDAERRAYEEEEGYQAPPVSEGSKITKKGETCSHMNKSRPSLMTINGKMGFYQKCTECNSTIKFRSAVDKRRQLESKAPDGVSFKDKDDEG